ncbi:PREDICTED: putative pentatricopeptide repeat-containing protein At1g12700, mitochondrial [Erythranthe guttata]|uniref:putative pentatricopeptide repeat-containing protein At1g12700, mitochondrial n=1 Tax=Erythranthe guttata TaxID=4155 RepID=UPI00064D7842|nr:PREDICTED: putative pentatricopeptide repeat-containing protein At1g12700, mitochondrial [Erythranthe guttata]|eukprot:XP_012845016.1 PREDICTED: putative pentatricopeptide repeat-containing protein At1g12700, mitochondrial [Erythranthe guttata]
MRASKIALVCRAITAKSSHERGIFTSSFSFSCHKFSTVPRTDSICINELDDTVFLIRKMMRMRPRPSVFELTKQLQVIVKMKQYSVALKLFDEMRQWGAPVNVYTMNILINCCCHLRWVDFSFAVFGSFLKHGYEPNVTTFNTLLKGLFLDGNVAEAEKLFKKILTLKLCEPDDVTILTVIDELCKAGRVHTARDLLLLLEKTIYKPSVKAYSAVIDCLCKGGMVDNALELLELVEMYIGDRDESFLCIVIRTDKDNFKIKGTTLRVHEPASNWPSSQSRSIEKSMHLSNLSEEATRETIDSLSGSSSRSRVLLLRSSLHDEKAKHVDFILAHRPFSFKGGSWKIPLSNFGEVSFYVGYWEWTEDVLGHYADTLRQAKIYAAVHASLFTYVYNKKVLRAFL